MPDEADDVGDRRRGATQVETHSFLKCRAPRRCNENNEAMVRRKVATLQMRAIVAVQEFNLLVQARDIAPAQFVDLPIELERNPGSVRQVSEDPIECVA